MLHIPKIIAYMWGECHYTICRDILNIPIFIQGPSRVDTNSVRALEPIPLQNITVTQQKEIFGDRLHRSNLFPGVHQTHSQK